MLSKLKGVGKVTENKLNSLGIYDYETLLGRTPVGYMDMSTIAVPNECLDGDFCLFEGKIVKISKPFKKGKLEILKAEILCDKEAIKLVWFNRNYTVKILKADEIYLVYGKVKVEKQSRIIYNPCIEEKTDKITMCGIKPVYWTRGLIPQKAYTALVKQVLDEYSPWSIVPESVENKCDLMPLKEAYVAVHFPTNINNYKAKERITLEKIARRICAFRIAQSQQVQAKNRVYDKNINFSPLYDLLPFALNESQIAALNRLIEVFASNKKVNAVLCGDVGSGKTVVAVASAYYVVKNGYKVAIMAPTEILAKQHYNFINPIFSRLGINVCFLSGSTKRAQKDKLCFGIKSGIFDVIIGTHSLLNIGDEIPDLGFVVADEQHRFGVAQRTGLISKGRAVDVLTLSATPIPRSMQLVAYGEVEYITIERRFCSSVKTAIVPCEKRTNMWRYIAERCLNGEQAYIIAPKIFDVDGTESESVENLFEEIKEFFTEDKIGLLHGKISAVEKQNVLDKFYRNELSVLISTTVVEVGIDVPNASLIAIMDADRFGLASLHQLRGRVGRNGQQSYCFLYTAKAPSEGLKTLCSCTDGFELAEKDFELRGGGDIFGLDQSGTGTIEGLTPRTLRLAKNIADGVDLKCVERQLEKEIESFSLTDVSLT